MSGPTPSGTTPPTGPSQPNGPTSGPSPAPATSASTSKPEPLAPLTGFRSALQHTGIPRGVLLWKPRLPSRNWTIFWTISGTLLYLYYDDRRQCKIIKEETIKKVEHLGREVMPGGSLGEVRKIRVYGARCPEDGDDDRALRYFRKYMKVSRGPNNERCETRVLMRYLAIPSSRWNRLRIPTRPSDHPRLDIT